MDAKRELLRHTVAALAYRGAKTVAGAPQGFEATRVCATTRSAGEILAHIGDLLEWGLSTAQGKRVWSPATPQPGRAALQRLDDYLATDAPLGCPVEKLFQGPIADALTHVGQLATLRRFAGSPVRGENYFEAEIVAGRVGPEQSSVRREFD